MSSTMLRRAFSSTTRLASGECVEKICCITFLSSMVDAILSPSTPLQYHSHPLHNTSHRDSEDSLCCVGEECLQATIYSRFLLYQQWMRGEKKFFTSHRLLCVGRWVDECSQEAIKKKRPQATSYWDHREEDPRYYVLFRARVDKFLCEITCQCLIFTSTVIKNTGFDKVGPFGCHICLIFFVANSIATLSVSEDTTSFWICGPHMAQRTSVEVGKSHWFSLK